MAWMTWHWKERPEPHEIDATWLSEQTPLRQTLMRFNHACRGAFEVPLRGCTLSFLLEDDLAMVVERLPAWLATLAVADGKADLLFSSQGTELILHADRSGESIMVSATRLGGGGWAIDHPIAVPARIFFTDWRPFLLSFLDAMAAIEPASRRNGDWRRYRALVAAVAENDER
jgi:hypothetical protein